MTAITQPDISEDDRRETMSNHDLYSMTPPAYAQSAADNETTVDAEAMQDEKLGMPGQRYAPSHSSADDTVHDGHMALATLTAGPPSMPAVLPNELPPVYFEELTREAAIASIKRCAILPNRPAVWLMKKKDFALSPLAATVLLKEGIIKSKDLELISTSAGVKRDPNDPLSGIAFATFDTVGDILLGLIEGPVQAAKQVSPMLAKAEQRRKGEPPTIRYSVRQESSPLMHQNDHDGRPASGHQQTWTPPQADETESWQPRVWSDAEQKPGNPVLEAAPNAAKEVAISTGKGFGRIVGAGLKAPMTFTHGITRGFHNLPKLYGDEVRETENITDLRSGIEVSAKNFGHGIGDGLRDFFVQPIIGAQKEGGKGFVKGFGKGVGNLVCKPSAGIVGLVGYSSVGVYKSLQNLRPASKDDTSTIFKDHGEMEYQQAPEQTRGEVVRRWCQMNMTQSIL
ncbi:hypothetical protein BU24DRAFT_427470 [Aaosphaeria arxii CBS 175.79]|uniref:Glycosyltransferase family 1 protein n=1 Tax=Aaosphaeria arxii CBS 175.79 TaxID=1450172 RepID=A0A6A5XBJ8_9PLEO|nr:uncharacterized protein BU24DRAFT_427470 [Aaosphaeria arxii CBS 175.79]KAF2010342.1 hypothetical protein BU24DRAFT_427470 [Aaosphaeria arxii CBS 175.79]